MPHIYPHKTAGWRVIYRVWFPDGTHKDKVRYAKKKQIAQLLYSDAELIETHSRRQQITKDELTRAINAGFLTPAEAVQLHGGHVAGSKTWRELRKGYEDWSRANCRTYTHACNVIRAEGVVKYFQNTDPCEITKTDIELFISKRRAEKKKTATVLKDLVALRRLLDSIDPDNNPARKIRLPKIDDEVLPRALDRDEIKIFLETVEDYKGWLYGAFKPIVFVYLFAGLRPSEIVRLKAEDVDMKNCKLRIHGQTKTGHARTVEIHPELRPVLAELKGPQAFGGEHKIDSKSVSRAIKKVMVKAGLKNATPYSLRHSFVSYLLMAGATLREVMDAAGHKKLSTTTRYLHTIPQPESPVHRIDFSVKRGKPTSN